MGLMTPGVGLQHSINTRVAAYHAKIGLNPSIASSTIAFILATSGSSAHHGTGGPGSSTGRTVTAGMDGSIGMCPAA